MTDAGDIRLDLGQDLPDIGSNFARASVHIHIIAKEKKIKVQGNVTPKTYPIK